MLKDKITTGLYYNIKMGRGVFQTTLNNNNNITMNSDCLWEFQIRKQPNRASTGRASDILSL
jgi:hypothetical protein